ncbi:tRNA(fMet)-specific endonuclease VapC [Algoriphagus alkaliphilus]|uniref:tRNA(fMet)-specific endonuclease VapC n=1 Tax=Algoriphagus alkaliphilus TaxID=279824 RepID=A0A1G5ZQA7_9BACT|nr:type II toxin-antitoxin system VapC family toxin [Algoriphagus alkaliphilus]SDA96760.1 tRNA(fMet)-specific endonuclease VapC [Algoriphagus alkaliphilus]
MTRLVLDTNILIQVVRGKALATDVKALIDGIENPELYLSVVSLVEAESLAIKWKWQNQKITSLKNLMDSLICIDITANQKELLEAYVRLDAYSQSKGTDDSGKMLQGSSRNMGKNDLWIAATTYALDAELITMDGDFDHLKDIWFPIHKFKI